MEQLQPIACVGGSSGGSASKAEASKAEAPSEGGAKPSLEAIEEHLATVDDSRQKALTLNTKEAREALEAALRAFLLELGSHDVLEADMSRLDQKLAADAKSFKTALLRPLNTCAVYRGYAVLPTLVEQTRRMLAATPAKGSTALFEVLMQDIDLCNDLRILESVQETLEFMVGNGRLRARVGTSFDGSVELPAAHQEACRTATLRSQKRQEAVRAWRRTQKMKALSGLVCVRYEGANEAIDV
eukprot:5667512-Prymnesium_polylepis.1